MGQSWVNIFQLDHLFFVFFVTCNSINALQPTPEGRLISVCSVWSYNTTLYTMRGSRKFCHRGSNFENVFFVCVFFLYFFFHVLDEDREDPNNTICGPSSARQRNAI